MKPLKAPAIAIAIVNIGTFTRAFKSCLPHGSVFYSLQNDSLG